MAGKRRVVRSWTLARTAASQSMYVTLGGGEDKPPAAYRIRHVILTLVTVATIRLPVRRRHERRRAFRRWAMPGFPMKP